MTAIGWRGLIRIHRWSALATGVFALLLCLTGLPLLFAHEISALGSQLDGSSATKRIETLNALTRAVIADHPGASVQYLGQRGDGARFASYIDAQGAWHSRVVDRDGRRALRDQRLGQGVMAWVTDLHARLLSGATGQWLLAIIGGVMLIALISGLVLHGPFAPREGPLAPRSRRTRLAWLDRHNLLGMGITLWAVLLVASGVLLALAGPIQGHWRDTTLAALAASAPQPTLHGHAISPDDALAAAHRRWPDACLDFMALPGSDYATPHGYIVYLAGNSGPGALLHHALWVGAQGDLRDRIVPLGLGMQTEMLAKRLHLGTFGGLAIRLLWAALDGVLIVVIASGLWLWLTRVGPRLAPRRSAALAGGT